MKDGKLVHEESTFDSPFIHLPVDIYRVYVDIFIHIQQFKGHFALESFWFLSFFYGLHVVHHFVEIHRIT